MSPGKLEPQTETVSEGDAARNPFGVQDAPDPDGQDVVDFAAVTAFQDPADDANAEVWGALSAGNEHASLGGNWSSRWKGGVDPTIAGDAKDKWKQGQAEVKLAGHRIYILFNWDNGHRRALIDARRENGARLVGRYLNLTDPSVTRAWVGLVVDNRRIDGKFPGEGRLDFRR